MYNVCITVFPVDMKGNKMFNDFNVLFTHESGELHDFQETGRGPFATYAEAEAYAQLLMAKKDCGYESYRIGSMKEYLA